MRLMLVGSLVLVVGGCYTYGPAPAPTPAPGTPIRLELTDRGTADLAALLGPGAVAVEGRYGGGEDSLRVGVTTVRYRRGADQFWSGEAVVVPRDAVARLEQRRFSRTRTLLLVGALAAGAFAISEAVGGEEAEFGGRVGGPPGQGQ